MTMKQKDPPWPTVNSKEDGSREIALTRQDPQGSSQEGQGEQMNIGDLQIAQWIRKMPDLVTLEFSARCSARFRHPRF